LANEHTVKKIASKRGAQTIFTLWKAAHRVLRLPEQTKRTHHGGAERARRHAGLTCNPRTAQTPFTLTLLSHDQKRASIH
jgi:hypothetical protein